MKYFRNFILENFPSNPLTIAISHSFSHCHNVVCIAALIKLKIGIEDKPGVVNEWIKDKQSAGREIISLFI